MKFPKRFGLSTLMLLMLAVATVCGFLTWRANTLRSEVARINKEGVGHLTLSDGWFFPVLGDEGLLKLRKDINGGLLIAKMPASINKVMTKFEHTAEEMRELGVQEVKIVIVEERAQLTTTVEVVSYAYADNLSGNIARLANEVTWQPIVN